MMSKFQMSESRAHKTRRTPNTRGTRRRWAASSSVNAFRLIPTLMTLGNLVAGVVAIAVVAQPAVADGAMASSGLTAACLIIIIGMVLDGLDGTAARLTGTTSRLGAQLDSLADIVTFGVAPGFILARLAATIGATPATFIGGETILGRLTWGAVFIYICCAALRLARGTIRVMDDEEIVHRDFMGMPAPAAAGVVIAMALLVDVRASALDDLWTGVMAWMIPTVTAGLAACMVSTIRFPHIVQHARERTWGARAIAGLLGMIVLLLAWPREALAGIVLLYVCWSPIRAGIGRTSSTNPDGADTLCDSHD